MKNKRILPPTYLFTTIALMVLLHWFVPILIFASYPWNLLGLIPLTAGTVLNLFANAALKNKHTTVKPFQKSTALITTGVYPISRHPMYLGMILILLGLAILMGSVSPLMVIPVFGVMLERIFISSEEGMLGEQFGAAWSSYKHRVRKWI